MLRSKGQQPAPRAKIKNRLGICLYVYPFKRLQTIPRCGVVSCAEYNPRIENNLPLIFTCVYPLPCPTPWRCYQKTARMKGGLFPPLPLIVGHIIFIKKGQL